MDGLNTKCKYDLICDCSRQVFVQTSHFRLESFYEKILRVVIRANGL